MTALIVLFAFLALVLAAVLYFAILSAVAALCLAADKLALAAGALTHIDQVELPTLIAAVEDVSIVLEALPESCDLLMAVPGTGGREHREHGDPANN